jgi:bacillithiol system protein YtxJ
MGFFNRNKKESKESIRWNELNNISDLDQAIELSFEKPVLLFKHSTRCSISSMALNRTESGWDIPEEELVPFYLDLIAHRDVSAAIADKLNVFHQSPQIILVKGGKVVLDASHNEIRVDLIKSGL